MVDDCQCGAERSRRLGLQIAQIAPQFNTAVAEVNRQRVLALRVLNRHLANAVYQALLTDSKTAHPNPPLDRGARDSPREQPSTHVSRYS